MIELDRDEKKEVDVVKKEISAIEKFNATKTQEKHEEEMSKVLENEKTKETEKEEAKDIAVWQFKYRNYKEITNFADPDAPPTVGLRAKPKRVISARNFRLELDLNIPIQKQEHEHLMKSQQKGISFHLLSDIDETDTIATRALTLEKLVNMSEAQLIALVTPEELEAMGIIGVPRKMEMVMAIIDSKKLQS